VPKSFFALMYVFALLCCLVPLYMTRRGDVIGVGIGGSVAWLRVLWARPHLVLLAVHSSRRLLECMFLTIFGSSQMHISGVAVGLLHYAAVAACFCEVHVDADLPLALWVAAGGVFVLGNVMQHRLHLILYRIKEDQRLAYKLRLARGRRDGRSRGDTDSRTDSVRTGVHRGGMDESRQQREVRRRARRVQKDATAAAAGMAVVVAAAPEANASAVDGSPSTPADPAATTNSPAERESPETVSSSSSRQSSRQSSRASSPASVRSSVSAASLGSTDGDGASSGNFVTPQRRTHRRDRGGAVGVGGRKSSSNRTPRPPPSPHSYRYEVPRGSWFQRLCCPHYSAEILVYVSFLLLDPSSKALQTLLLWVTSNLAVTGRRQLLWYRTNDQLRGDVPRDWCVLLPGVF